MASEKVSNFFRKRFIELLGVTFLTLGAFSIVSFFSYDPYDPSFNIASNAKVKNLGGVAGAYISGPVLSFIGLGCVIMVLVPFLWGLQLVRNNKLTKLWLKVTLLAVCIPSAAAMASLLDFYLDVPERWPSNSFGGFIGSYLQDNLSPLIGMLFYVVSVAALTFTSLFFVSGLTLKQWSDGTLQVYNFFATIFHGIINGFYFLKTKIFRISTEKTYRPKKVYKRKVSDRKIVGREEKKESIKVANQSALDLNMRDNYQMPPLDLLEIKTSKPKNTITESALSQNAELLEKVLDDFGVNGKITEVHPGPVVTLYALEPSPGTKSSRVIGLADDIARSMSAVSARIAVIPGQNAIGIELPNANREIVYLRELIESDEFKNTSSILPLALGKDIAGEAIEIDLAKTPHLLVAGTTGSGKSVGINAMILSLLYKYTPDECKLIMIDPKMLELSAYQDIPHLLTPVVTEPGKAVVALKWTVKEMENRYRLMSNLGVRNLLGYNQRIEEAKAEGKQLSRSVQTGFDPETGKPIIEEVELDMNPLPYIVVVVDEMADLMMVAGKDIEGSVQRLAQMARAAGIHIIMATQRPSVDVITGVIKANFPTRLSFQVTSKVDSRTILGEQGAEQLLGQGDMLYMAGGNRITRIHGPFVKDEEVGKVVSFLKKQGAPSYIEEVTKEDDEAEGFLDDSEKDELYDKAVAIVCQDGKASTSYIQRVLKIGYNRAANIIEQMERDGVVSPANHVGKREILVA